MKKKVVRNIFCHFSLSIMDGVLSYHIVIETTKIQFGQQQIIITHHGMREEVFYKSPHKNTQDRSLSKDPTKVSTTPYMIGFFLFIVQLIVLIV
jgi:hypothetical protein